MSNFHLEYIRIYNLHSGLIGIKIEFMFPPSLAGNLVDWWEPSTKASYLRKASCIIDQYGSYKIPRLGLSLNGINTQGENIADNGGIKEAYRAYSE